ncbi:MAG: DNA repair protein [Williamsia sp.]|nr:DNA repair protein [Williamsia sp.]
MSRTIKHAFNASHLPSHVAEVELIYRNKVKSSERPLVKESNDAYSLFLKSWDMNKIELQEQFRIMLLDRRSSCMGIATVATGGMTDCLVDLRIVFAAALKARAANIILAHNHPSNNISPSEADKNLTARFSEAGKLLNLLVLDHLIVTKEGYTSLADEGLMFRAS